MVWAIQKANLVEIKSSRYRASASGGRRGWGGESVRGVGVGGRGGERMGSGGEGESGSGRGVGVGGRGGERMGSGGESGSGSGGWRKWGRG